MKIELQYPYTQDFRSGSTFINHGSGRTYLSLTRHDGSNTSTAYARYLMAVKIGRYLREDETADHISEDRRDDSRDNLQILSLGANIAKHNEMRASGGIISLPPEPKRYACIDCAAGCTNKEGRCRDCATKVAFLWQPRVRDKIDREALAAVADTASGNLSRIAEHYGVSRNTAKNWLIQHDLFTGRPSVAGTKEETVELWRECGGNMNEVARRLNCNKSTVKYRLQKLGLIH